MKLIRPLFLWFVSVVFLHAQTTDPARVEELQKRFKAGIALENQGKLTEALAVFEGIIKDEPKARGSLFYAGFVTLRLGEAEKALGYIEAFRQLQPNDFKGLVLAIQANQALRRNIKVEALRKELYTLRGSAPIPGLSDAKSYPRERMKGDRETLILINEFFDYKAEPNLIWEAQSYDANGVLQRDLVVSYDEKETTDLRQKDPKYQAVEVCFFSEYVLKDGQMKQINIYRREPERPSYEKAREWILSALKQPPAPLVTVPAG